MPIDIRRRLGLHEGDKIVFAEQDGNIVIFNSNSPAWEQLQSAFAGEAKRVGWSGEDDVAAYRKEIRREMGKERRGRSY
ncbi:MAG: AbrB/MazE/SpoVT family DNA-binding domain-containing protein [Clostridiales bacterium]|nr:AbrB/MazE/SpoVT family DNA-binding domain-containing protein [Clostridiales bacterium]